MTFSTDQIKNLGAKLSARFVKTREVEGRQLSYLEGWHVIAEANRIFGYDAWDRETISNDCVWQGMRRGCPSCAYVAKVRITVRAGPLTVTREGSGSGQGTAIAPGEAHEIALKAAETDATKRALSTFGNPFGLALYDKERAGVRKRRAGRTEPKSNGRNTVVVHGGDASHRRNEPDAPRDRTARLSGADDLGPGSSGARQDSETAEPPTASLAAAPDKSALAIAEPHRVRRPEHLRYVASQPCLICGRRPAEAHHLTFAQPRGLSIKSSDEYTVPLCRAHHRQLHANGDEEAWWRDRGIDAVAFSECLWREHREAQTG